jgi:hypothetical protein
MKFYGLPLEPPKDRHKWFFSAQEATRFVEYRAEKNQMQVLQMDFVSRGSEGIGWRRYLRQVGRRLLLRPNLHPDDLYAGTLWAVLKKQD